MFPLSPEPRYLRTIMMIVQISSNGCSDPSTLCFVPAGNSITVSANSPIGESGLVVNNTTLAPNDCAFQLISVNVQLNPNQIK